MNDITARKDISPSGLGLIWSSSLLKDYLKVTTQPDGQLGYPEVELLNSSATSSQPDSNKKLKDFYHFKGTLIQGAHSGSVIKEQTRANIIGDTYSKDPESQVNPSLRLKKVPSVLWEGCVTDVDNENGVFYAEVIDKLGGTPNQLVEMFIDEIPDEDRSLIYEGAVFYWTIGKVEGPLGQQMNFDEIHFRRQPNWTEAKIKSAELEAEKLRQILLNAVE